MSQILYSGDGNGVWIRREWHTRCPRKFPVTRLQCQGIEGHSGLCWRYTRKGEYEVFRQGVGSVVVATDHHEYVPPEDKASEHFLQNFTDMLVTDPAVIDLLEGGKTPEPEAGWSCPYSRGSQGDPS